MALKNSKTGSLPVSEIYNFMTEHFPYFKVSSTGMGRGISLHVYVSTGNKGWDSSCEQRQFLRRLTPNQLHTAYSHDHKLHSILQKCEMWWYWTQKSIKSCSSCELGNVTVTIPHQQPIKRAKNCKKHLHCFLWDLKYRQNWSCSFLCHQQQLQTGVEAEDSRLSRSIPGYSSWATASCACPAQRKVWCVLMALSW